jgi:hypothetical protein
MAQQRRNTGCQNCGHGGSGNGHSSGGGGKIWKWIGAAVLIWYLMQSGALQTDGGIGGGNHPAPKSTGVCNQYFKGGC